MTNHQDVGNNFVKFMEYYESIAVNFTRIYQRYNIFENEKLLMSYGLDHHGVCEMFNIYLDQDDYTESLRTKSQKERDLELVLKVHSYGNPKYKWHQTNLDNLRKLSEREIIKDFDFLFSTYEKLENLYPKVSVMRTLDCILGIDSEYYESSRC